MSSSTTAELLEAPVIQPPEGVIANFAEFSGTPSWYYVCAVFCTVVPGVLLLLRLYTKMYIVRKMDLTDGLILPLY